jgi:hypothetical protein
LNSLSILIYSTSHCHLCEQAESLLAYLSSKHPISWTKVEISEDAELLERYGTRIPVLKRIDNNNTELAWPFTTTEIEQLLLL